MKALKIIIATLAGLFALAHCVYLPVLVLRGEPISGMMGSLAGLCIGAALSVALFRSAFAHPKGQGANAPPEQDAEPRPAPDRGGI
jgi:hypothetical protein